MARRLAAFTTAVGMLLVALLVVWPFATKDRALPATVPQPPAIKTLSLVEVPAGGRACLKDVAVDQHSALARVKVGSEGVPGPPLTLVLTGEGYRAVARQPGGYPDNAVVDLPVRPPRAVTEVDACLRNGGTARILLYGTADRAQSTALTYVDGKRVPANFQLAFFEARPASFADRAATIADRTTRFRPGGAWLAWLLAGLVLVGVPVALVGAVAASAEEE